MELSPSHRYLRALNAGFFRNQFKNTARRRASFSLAFDIRIERPWGSKPLSSQTFSTSKRIVPLRTARGDEIMNDLLMLASLLDALYEYRCIRNRERAQKYISDIRQLYLNERRTNVLDEKFEEIKTFIKKEMYRDPNVAIDNCASVIPYLDEIMQDAHLRVNYGMETMIHFLRVYVEIEGLQRFGMLKQAANYLNLPYIYFLRRLPETIARQYEALSLINIWELGNLELLMLALRAANARGFFLSALRTPSNISLWMQSLDNNFDYYARVGSREARFFTLIFPASLLTDDPFHIPIIAEEIEKLADDKADLRTQNEQKDFFVLVFDWDRGSSIIRCDYSAREEVLKDIEERYEKKKNGFLN